MQICVSGFSWHPFFSSSTRSGEFLIIINPLVDLSLKRFSKRVVVARRLSAHSLFPVQAVRLSTFNRGVCTTFLHFLTFSGFLSLNLRLGDCTTRHQTSYRLPYHSAGG